MKKTKSWFRHSFKLLTAMALGITVCAVGIGSAEAAVQANPNSAQVAVADNFYKSNQVSIQKVSFVNQYAMKVTGNLVIPKNINHNGKTAAIIVGHPMGAVKEQSSMLYAQKLAEQGFVTLAIDLPFWGESEGMPRNLVAPELYTEAFSAAVDYLGSQSFIDRDQIGVLGICGSGGFAINAAKIDPRLKAIATISMYDMGAVTRDGLNHSLTLEQRQDLLTKAAEQRYREFASGKGEFLNYLPAQLSENTDPVTKEFWEFYRTERGIHIPKGRTLELTQNRMLTSEVRFMNFYPFNDMETISPRPMLFVAGENAHSIEFSQDAYRLAKEPKELYLVPNAGHVDLYDRAEYIPFEKLTDFFRKNLS